MKKIYFALIALSVLFSQSIGAARANEMTLCQDGICPSVIVSSLVSPGIYSFSVQEACADMVISWHYGDGQQISDSGVQEHEYAEGGVYIVSATFEDADCSEGVATTITTTIFVELPTCEASVLASQVSCGNFVFTVNSNFDFNHVVWSTSNGIASDANEFSAHFSAPGSYEVFAEVTSPTCGTIVSSTTIIVEGCTNCPSEMVVETSQQCGNYTFHIAGFAAQGNIVWDFGDGSTAGGSNNVNHQFTAGGVYTITATAWTGDCPNGATIVQTVNVPNCTIDCPIFTTILEQSCGILVMSGETVINEPIHWTADGVEVNVGNTTTFQLTPGGHVICASITNVACGAAAITHCQEVFIENCNNCPSNIEVSNTSCGHWNFTIAGSFSNESNVAWYVNNGEFITHVGSHFEFVPTELGCYTISAQYLGVECVSGITLETTVCHEGCESVNCPSNLVASEVDCHNFAFHVDDTTTGSVTWNFGDNSVEISGINTTHNYTSNGTFTVTAFYVGDACTSGVMFTQTIVVDCIENNCPSIITGSTSNENCMFWNFELGPTADNITIVWHFGDGSTSQTTTHLGQHQYTSPGLYTVSAIYYSAACPNGSESTYTVEVSPCPENCLIESNVLSQQCGLLVMSASSNMQEVIHWSVDGETSPTAGGIITFNLNPGVHTVCAFYETNTCGLITSCHEIVIESCNDCHNVILTMDSSPSNGGPSSITWALQNETSGTIESNGTALYTAIDPYFDHLDCLMDGCYVLVLESDAVLLDNNGLAVTINMNNTSIPYEIDPASTEHHVLLRFGINSDCGFEIPVCEPNFNYEFSAALGTVVFNNTSVFSGVATFNWNFGNNHISNITSPSITYSEDGIYEVCLTIETSEGCTNTICENIEVSGLISSCDQNSAQIIIASSSNNPDQTYLVQGIVSHEGQIVATHSFQVSGVYADTLSLCLPTGCYGIALQALSGLNTESNLVVNVINNLVQESQLEITLGSPSIDYELGLNFNCGTSLESEFEGNRIHVFPNPAQNELNVQFDSEGYRLIQLIDNSGRTVEHMSNNSSRFALAIEHLASGIYYLRVVSDQTTDIQKIEIIH